MSSRGVSLPVSGHSPDRGRFWCSYLELEEFQCGMWRPVASQTKQLLLISLAVRLFRDEGHFRAATGRVVTEWPISCRASLTAPINHIAWMGQAACCIVHGVPEELTRRAWWKLDEKQRADCDEIAAIAVSEWLAKNATAGLPLFSWTQR